MESERVDFKKFNKVHREDIMEIYTDGSAGENPGKGAGAFLFILNDEIIYEESFYFGDVTVNQAEYRALINALDRAIEYTRWNIKVFSDSEFLIKQMNGDWRVKDPIIKTLFRNVGEMERGFRTIDYLHVPRSNKYISRADMLCKQCINKHTEK